MTDFKYTIIGQGRPHVFKDLATAWKFADDNGLPRCERIKETNNVHPYLKGPIEWSTKLQFWHSNEPGKIKYSQKAKDYYDNWLSNMWLKERVATNLQTGLQ